MKTLVCRAFVMLAASLWLAVLPSARATILVHASSSFSDLSITAAAGSLDYTSAFQSEAYGQAGANSQYNSGAGLSSASASDIPVPGGSASGSGTASASAITGTADASGFIPGSVAGFDTSAGRASDSATFEITGVATQVDVTLSLAISGELSLSSDSYGVSGQGEDVLTLSLNGNTELFYDLPLSIGPDQSLDQPFSTALTTSLLLTPDTSYSLWIEADAEASVLNSSVVQVPEPSESALAGCMAMAALAFIWWRRRRNVKWGQTRRLMLAAGAASVLAVIPAHAKYLGSDAPDVCEKCGIQPTRQQAGGIGTSLSEGNMQEVYPVVTVKSTYGDTLPFKLTYNSYNADGSKAQLNSGLGFGWTDTDNRMLFSERGQMFELGDDGRVTRYYPTGPDTYQSDSGYFETMTMELDGTFIVTNKDESWWHYGTVSNTPFMVEGPVYRLTQTGDRDGNITTYTYNSSGELTSVADTYGRTLQFTYNSSNELSSITDPMGRTTTFQYDPQDREITQIEDPLGRTTTYTYNSQYQMTEKVDRDGRTFMYMYKGDEPFAVSDSQGDSLLSLSNETDWAVNTTNLAFNLQRQYVPSTTYDVDGRGNLWTYTYDKNGYITESVQPDGATTIYTYDPGSHLMTSTTDRNGNTTQFQYDTQGNRTNTTDALGEVTRYTYDPVFNQVTSMTDASDRVTTYQYDATGNRVQEIDPLNETNSWSYDSHGNVLSYTDRLGHTTIYTYDAYGNHLSMTDPLGNITWYTYDADGDLTSRTDPRGNTTTYQYDVLNRKIAETNALGGITRYTYDNESRLLSDTDPNTNTISYQYDFRGRLIETIYPDGSTRTTAYDLNDNEIAKTNQLGNVTTYAYDAENRLIDATNPLREVTTTTYDAVGNQLSTTDPAGNVTSYAYDALNREIVETNALGGTTRYDYSSPSGPPCCSPTAGSSLVTEIIDADGNITFYHYDELNRLTQVIRKNSDTNNVINPGDAVTTTTYDADGNETMVTDPVGNTTLHSYDADNRQISMIDGAGDTTLTSYDADGNVLTITSPNGNITTNNYDALNRVVTVYDAIGIVSTTTYDADSNVIMMTDALGDTTTNAYDALNRRIMTTDPLGQTSTTLYDADGNVVTNIDRNEHVTQTVYDALDRQISIIDPLGNTTRTYYDADGNSTNVTDADGQVTTYSYDALNRKVTETYPDISSNTVTYQYDAVGNRIERTDQDGRVTTYTYDDLYYLTNRTYSPSGSADTYTYDLAGRMLNANRNGWVDTFEYDGASRVTNSVQNGQAMTYDYDIPGRAQTNTYPSGRTITYQYDARNRLTGLGDETLNPPITTYTYDGADRVITRDYRNGTTATYTYDADNRVTSLQHSNTLGLITGYGYIYDHEGNKLYEEKFDNPSNSETYAYDALNRLTNYDVGQLSGPIIPIPLIYKSWVLDAVGNWDNLFSNSIPDVRTYGPANELLTDNAQNYTYDAAGNLIKDSRYLYSYDEENRLIEVQRVSDSGIAGQYVYDALGRRIKHIGSPVLMTTTNVYLYDNQRIIEETDGGVLPRATYTYGNYVDEVLTMDRSGQTYYYHPNALWSVEALSDGSGNVVERYTYDAYGSVKVLNSAYVPLALNAWGTPHSAVTNEFLFTGRELDEEAGLYFYRARSYDSLKGRFLQRDPIGYADSMNLYIYVRDNPINRVDPSGHLSARGIWDGKINTIVCDGKGGIVVRLGMTNPCLENCMKKHEESHIADALAIDKDICKDKPENTQIRFSRLGSPSELKTSELKAYKAELECLNDTLKDCPKECTRDYLMARIKQINDLLATDPNF